MRKDQYKLLRETIKESLVEAYGFHSNPEKSKMCKGFLDLAIERIKGLVEQGKLPKTPRRKRKKK